MTTAKTKFTFEFDVPTVTLGKFLNWTKASVIAQPVLVIEERKARLSQLVTGLYSRVGILHNWAKSVKNHKLAEDLLVRSCSLRDSLRSGDSKCIEKAMKILEETCEQAELACPADVKLEARAISHHETTQRRETGFG